MYNKMRQSVSSLETRLAKKKKDVKTNITASKVWTY